MSSDVQSALQFLVPNNYVSLAAITAVVYDYALTFSREVEYVWCRPWTWVSTMFVVVRYIGLYWTVTTALNGTSFVPGPVEVGKIVFLSSYWTFVVFLSTADLTTIQILDFSVCSDLEDNPFYPVYFVALRLVLSALLGILAVFQTLKQSFEMYKATKQWQPNCYMQKLMKDGILYFIVNVLYQIIDLLNITKFYSDTTSIFLEAFISITFYILIPRFIISIRELYDRDIRGRFHIDTGFGVVSQLNASQDTTVSAMVFVDGNQGAEVEGSADNSGDLGMGKVHGSRLHEDSPLEPGSSRV